MIPNTLPMQKWFVLSLLLVLSGLNGSAQVLDPIKWNYEVKELDDNTYELTFRAKIDENWHLYGTEIPEGGPVATSVNIEESEDYQLVGDLKEVTEPDKKEDPTFNMTLALFSEEAVLTQKVKKNTNAPVILAGFVEYMSCDDTRCLPPKSDDFELVLGDSEKFEAAGKEAGSGQTEGGLPGIEIAREDISIEGNQKADESGADKIEDTSSVTNLSITSEASPEKEDKSTLVFFLISLLAGLAGILTPCVFPMIPMTVSFFMNQSGGGRGQAILKGLIFGVSIIVIYTSIGLIVSLTSASANFANQISTHWIPNIIFFLLFIIFTASFFGMFEIVLPNSLVSKTDKQVDKGGYAGSFFMALTLVIVSFSCTGPIVGALLMQSAGGAVLKPTLGMFGFSLAFALPFTLFAIFPSWLKSLPKSGGWLNSVKVVLGFIIFAFAFKFLSIIDETYHLGILPRDIYLAIWIVTFFLLGMYLLGKIKFAHDADLPYISFPRLLLAIAVFTFVVYLIPGLFGAPLKGISPLLPPESNQNFNLTSMITSYGKTTAPSEQSPTFCGGDAKYDEFLDFPYGLKGYFDYEEGMKCAKELNKPVLLEFEGHACSNCKKMKGQVWSDPEVLKLLREEYVLIALYVDDRTKLPESEWITSEYDGKVKKTIGKKNADFQITRFNSNTQPFYVLLSPNAKMLTEPKHYDPNVGRYVDFLEKGLKAFN